MRAVLIGSCQSPPFDVLLRFSPRPCFRFLDSQQGGVSPEGRGYLYNYSVVPHDQTNNNPKRIAVMPDPVPKLSKEIFETLGAYGSAEIGSDADALLENEGHEHQQMLTKKDTVTVIRNEIG